MASKELFVGADVHYVLQGGPHHGECRPAKVLRIYDSGSSPPVVTLGIFCTGGDGRRYDGQGGYHVESGVLFGPPRTEDSSERLHWPRATYHFVALCVG